MAFADRRTINVLCTILFFTIVLVIVYVARSVLVIFAFSILFAYLIDPVVRYIQQHSLVFRNLRGPHVAEAYLFFLILIPLVIHFAAPGSLGKTTKLAKQIPAFVDNLSTGEIATQIGGKYGWSEPQQQRIKSLLVQHQANIQSVAGGWERSAVPTLAGLFVIPILAIFFLNDGREHGRFVHSHDCHKRQSRGAPVSRSRIEFHAASLHKGKSDPGGTLAHLLLPRYSLAPFPSFSRPRPPRRDS